MNDYYDVYFQKLKTDEHDVMAVCLTKEVDQGTCCFYGAFLNETYMVPLEFISDVNCLRMMDSYHMLKLKRIEGDMLSEIHDNDVLFIPYHILAEWVTDEQTIEGCENIRCYLDIFKEYEIDKTDVNDSVWHKMTKKEE